MTEPTPRPAHPSVPAEQILALATAATAADGVAPLGEQAVLSLGRRDESGLLTELRDGQVVAAAVSAPDDLDSIEVVVDPQHRRAGIGTGLISRVLQQQPAARFWAHGHLPAAQATARGLGLAVVRELWRMEKALTETPALRPLPDGLTARTFEPDRDEEAWLRVNARAFVHHPEQGRMTRADLDERMAQPWFDPTGLILVEDAETGALAGSHWTKIPTAQEQGGERTRGEVYVVAVDPDFQGRGLAGPLTDLGLRHLHDAGVRTVELYVEGDNHPAVATYTRAGFSQASADAMYARVATQG